MRRSTLTMCALLAVATSGCDRFPEQFRERFQDLVARFRGRDEPAAPTRPAAPAPRDTAPPTAAAPPPQAPRSPARPTTPRVAGPARPAEDTPFVSEDTGTVMPGAAERDVYAVWGPPVSVRRAGEWTYLFYRNGCEYTCGTYDVVFLHNGVVVDAIVRWWGHIYGGESSSPPYVVPLPTRAGDSLALPPSPPQ